MGGLTRGAVLALLVAAGTGTAQAGGPPILVGLGQVVTFELSGPADSQDVVLDAAAGADTWVGLTDDDEGGRATLLDPAGATVATFGADADENGPKEPGVEFRAPAAGRYTVRVTGDPESTTYPATVGVRYEADCRGDALTRCTIAPGHAKAADLGGGFDSDSFVVVAPAGRRYVARLETGYGPSLELVDGKGSVLRSRRVRGGTAEQRFYLPSRGGPYRLVVVGPRNGSHERGGPYALSLRAD